MNKKLLFGFMSLAALAACTNDDFESQNVVAEEKSPIQFEVINNDGDITRASMDGNKVVWKASDGDLFTLYHGATAPAGTDAAVATGTFSNAIYTAQAGGEGEVATLSTPSMINQGAAIMVWPVDTTSFSVAGGEISVKILANQTADIENHIPYVSDLVGIQAYDDKAPYNTAGYNRSYPVFMRPMASQLIVKADYDGTETVLAPLSTGDDAIEPIKVTSVALQSTSKPFTTKIGLTFKQKQAADEDRWEAAVKTNNWTHVTHFATTASASAPVLTTKCLTGNESSKFLILPQADVDFVETDAAVIVNTCYGQVSVDKTTYGAEDYAKAWYRYVSNSASAVAGETTTPETTGENAGKYKATAAVNTGLKQTIGGFSTYAATKGVAETEPVGASATRYVKVNLNKLNMNNLHVTTDKQLRDVVRVWQLLGTPSVTVFLDGDSDEEFKISQKTIAKINEINAAAAPARKFTVKPCTTEHNGNTIVITGGGEIPADLTFIVNNAGATVPVALNAGENWKWNSKNVTVDKTATGISKIINRGTFANDATATLKIMNNATTPEQVSTIGFENALGAKWDITAGDINVQFNVTNNGTVNIAKGAEYHQDKANATVTIFTNQAETVPERFYKNVADPAVTDKMKNEFVEKIGVVNNSGVFAALADRGEIENYGLIEHADKNAKTYITRNQTASVNFANAFGETNKMGRINLPIENKDEDNVSISAAAASGFVSVTVASTANITGVLKDGALDLSTLGTYVNYCIIKKGVTEITKVADQVKYIEFDDEDDTEIAWNLGGTVADKKTAAYDGLMILSPVNINLTTKITVSKATFLAAKLYVGGEFVTSGTKPYEGYFGKTTKNAETMYITY